MTNKFEHSTSIKYFIYFSNAAKLLIVFLLKHLTIVYTFNWNKVEIKKIIEFNWRWWRWWWEDIKLLTIHKNVRNFYFRRLLLTAHFFHTIVLLTWICFLELYLQLLSFSKRKVEDLTHTRFQFIYIFSH